MQLSFTEAADDLVSVKDLDLLAVADKLDKTHERLENVRKGTYKRHSDTNKLIMSMMETVARLETQVTRLQKEVGVSTWKYHTGNGELFEEAL